MYPSKDLTTARTLIFLFKRVSHHWFEKSPLHPDLNRRSVASMAERDPATTNCPVENSAEVDASHADDAGAAGEEDFSQQFTPLVELSEVETKTGEEEEEVGFQIRAKLFRFDKSLSEWKERGTGDIRILQHKENKKIRLLMRREKTLKICLNHYVNVGVELTENVGSDRSWVFHAVDYADGERDEAMLAIRFANSRNATLFKENYDRAREYMRALRSGDPLPENIFKKLEGPSSEKEESKVLAKEVDVTKEVKSTSTDDAKNSEADVAA